MTDADEFESFYAALVEYSRKLSFDAQGAEWRGDHGVILMPQGFEVRVSPTTIEAFSSGDPERRRQALYCTYTECSVCYVGGNLSFTPYSRDR